MEDGDPNLMPISDPSPFTREQKIGFLLLLALGLLAVVAGFFQIKNNLHRPFALNTKVPIAVKDDINTIDHLRFQDTDGDGLTDYDELFVYGSSPYLADSDSDGLPDGAEVKNGSDPLCPQGKVCSQLAGSTVALSSTSSFEFLDPAMLNNGVPPVDLAQAIQNPAELRKMLASSGVDEATLKKVSDADLLSLAADLFNTNKNGVSATSTVVVEPKKPAPVVSPKK